MLVTCIDADSLLYYSNKETIFESVLDLKSRLETIALRTKTSNCIICLSGKNYFRKKTNSEYKANRPPSQKYIQTLKSFLQEEYKVLLIDELEADDLVSYIKFNYSNVTIASPDKDVLHQTPGRHYNYQKDEFMETSKEDAIRFLLTQLISGDHTDNIKGIPGKGVVFANKVLTGSLEDNLVTCFKEYLNHYKTINKSIEEFYKNFKDVYLLKSKEDIELYLPQDFDIKTFINTI